jgi:AraC-like DNA-binding protein
MKRRAPLPFSDLPDAILGATHTLDFLDAWSERTERAVAPRTVTEPFAVLQIHLTGGGMHEVGGRVFKSRAGDVIFIGPGVRQSYHHSLGTKCDTVVFRLQSKRGPWVPDPPVIHLRGAWSLMGPFRQMIQAQRRETHPWGEVKKKCAFVLLWVELLKIQSHARSGAGQLSPAQVEKVYDLLDPNPDEMRTPTELSAALGLSHDHFSRCFTRTFGYSPKTFLLREKMNRAAHLLRVGDLNVSDTARRLGYQSMATFTRLFRQVHGVNPKKSGRT